MGPRRRIVLLRELGSQLRDRRAEPPACYTVGRSAQEALGRVVHVLRAVYTSGGVAARGDKSKPPAGFASPSST